MNDMLIVEKFLSEEFDLSKNETDLYVALLKHGNSTVLELSELTGINRATTHVNIDNLAKKKLITQVKKGQGSRRSIAAEPPEKLHVILKKKKAKIEFAEQQLQTIIPALSNLRESVQKNSGTEIRYYQGKSEVRFIYEESIKAKEFRAYFNCKKLSSVFPMNPANFCEEYNRRKDMHIWEIMEDSAESREYAELMPNNKRFHCRLVPKHINLSVVDYMIFDGKVAMVDFSEDKNITGVLVRNENHYQNAKAIHELVWQFLDKYKG